MALEIHDEEGDVTIRQKLPLSRLQPKARRKAKPGDKSLIEEATKQVGKEWTATMTVRSTGGDRTGARVYLNSETDFRSETNFAVALTMKGLKAAMAKAKIADVRKHYLGKKIRVTGKVTLYRDKPQIVVEEMKQIEVVE